MIYNKGFGRKKHEFSIKCIIKQLTINLQLKSVQFNKTYWVVLSTFEVNIVNIVHILWLKCCVRYPHVFIRCSSWKQWTL